MESSSRSIAPNEVPQSVEDTLREMQVAIEQLEAERDGMAEELLRVYEHLGILFEVTRRLPSARNEWEVVGLFVESLQRSYPESTVWLVPAEGQGDVTAPETSAYVACVGDEILDAAVARSRAERNAVVEQENPDTERGRQVLACPVYAGDTFSCTIVLSHQATGPAARPLGTGDMQLVESLATFCADLIRNIQLVAAMRQLSMDVVRVLVSTIDQKDQYTAGHSNRVGAFAIRLGKELGLSIDELQTLEWAALLHDVGKIGIRDDVLKKPGRLTDDEFDHIRTHPVRSAELVGQVPQLSHVVAGVRHHHERYDGSGYPDGLAGEDIPLLARIIQIADVFDALSTTRSYRKAFDWEKALGILLEEAGTTVDPHLAGVFNRMVRRMIEEDSGFLAKIHEEAAAQAAGQSKVVATTGDGCAQA